MVKTVEGQVTWADPDLGKKCFECKHCEIKFKNPPNRKTHVCKLVRLASGRNGVAYDGQRAIACSKFSAVDTDEKHP